MVMQECRGCTFQVGIPIEPHTFKRYPRRARRAWKILDKWKIRIHKNLDREITQEDMDKIPKKVKEAMDLIEKTLIPGYEDEGATGKDSCYITSLRLQAAKSLT